MMKTSQKRGSKAVRFVSAFALSTLTFGTAGMVAAQTAAPPPALPPPDAAPPAEAPPPAPVDTIPAPPPPVEIAPMPEPPPPPPAPPLAPAKPPVTSKFSLELYGFVELDAINDSTQSYNEVAGNAVIAKSGTYGGDHRRLTLSDRNSRIGLKMKGPESPMLKTSGVAEMDFLGNQPSAANQAGTAPLSDAALLTNPTFRIRHMFLKMETPYLTVLAGQTWNPFGWSGFAFPNTVQIFGLPAQIFNRTPQLRLSQAFKTDDVTVEVMVSGVRGAQRDGGWPDAVGGLRLLINKWKGVHTVNSTGTSIDAGGIGVSGIYRQLNVNSFEATPKSSVAKKAGGVSVDALIPIIPVTGTDRGNGLTLTGSFVYGTGLADLYTGLTGGVSNAALANPMMTTPAPAYTPNIDPGIVVYDAGGNLHTVDWRSFMVGAQYYVPCGCVWISANYSQIDSKNAEALFPASAKVFNRSQWADGNIFWDVNGAARLGLEFSWAKQKFIDGSTAKDLREQLAFFYIF